MLPGGLDFALLCSSLATAHVTGTVALLLTPTANKIVGQSAGEPTRSSERVVFAGRVALSLAAACTAFLLLDYGLNALLGPGLR